MPVFKTGAFNRSAIPPAYGFEEGANPKTFHRQIQLSLSEIGT